jgi:hypothetical protein
MIFCLAGTLTAGQACPENFDCLGAFHKIKKRALRVMGCHFPISGGTNSRKQRFPSQFHSSSVFFSGAITRGKTQQHSFEGSQSAGLPPTQTAPQTQSISKRRT